MSYQLRELRRGFGLSQLQLADLMRTTQSTISRWERGMEHIDESKRLELIDLFSNRTKRLDPIVKHLIRKNPNITVFGFDYDCLEVASLVSQNLKVGASEMVGNNYRSMVDTEWFTSVYGDTPLEERIYFEYERTMTAVPGGVEQLMPIRAKQFFIQFEDCDGIMLSVIERAPLCKSPRVIESVTTEALDFQIS